MTHRDGNPQGFLYVTLKAEFLLFSPLPGAVAMTKPATLQLRTTARPSPAAAEVPEAGEDGGETSLVPDGGADRSPRALRAQASAWPREGGLSPLRVWPPIKVSPPGPGHAFLRDSLRGGVWGLTGWNWGWVKGTGH